MLCHPRNSLVGYITLFVRGSRICSWMRLCVMRVLAETRYCKKKKKKNFLLFLTAASLSCSVNDKLESSSNVVWAKYISAIFSCWLFRANVELKALLPCYFRNCCLCVSIQWNMKYNIGSDNIKTRIYHWRNNVRCSSTVCKWDCLPLSW